MQPAEFSETEVLCFDVLFYHWPDDFCLYGGDARQTSLGGGVLIRKGYLFQAKGIIRG